MKIEINDEIVDKLIRYSYLENDSLTNEEKEKHVLENIYNILSEKDGFTKLQNNSKLRNDLFRDVWMNKNKQIYKRYCCIDIYDFQRYLDYNGYPESDKVLLCIVDYLKTKFEYEKIYRIGGEEFVIDLDNKSVIIDQIFPVKLKHTIVNFDIQCKVKHFRIIDFIEIKIKESILNSSIQGNKANFEYGNK